MRQHLAGAASVLSAMLGFVPDAHAAISLASHRATYDLSLEASADGATVAASGRMSFEVRDACTAWATLQTLSIGETDRDGGQSDTESDYATFETKDGRSLNFTMTQRSDGKVTSTIRGEATRDAGADTATVRFADPKGVILHLPPGTLFPMAHTRAILEAASAGRHDVAPLLFDGTGTDGAEYTYATILSWGLPHVPPPDRALDHVEAGRIHIAFYPLHDHGMTPEYEIGMRYFADGISDRLDMDFGDFTLRGQLRSLALLPPARGCAVRSRGAAHR